MKADVLFCDFPGQYQTQPDAMDWVRQSMQKAREDKRFGRVKHSRFYGTPITMLRNKALRVAAEDGFDYCVMIDADMLPDHDSRKINSRKPFWDSTVDFLFGHTSVPTMVFAPYVGPPPHENVYVFRWRNRETDHPNEDHQLEGYTREEAAILGGMQRAAAGPTGLIIIDTRLAQHVPPPWFYYGYTDRYESDKDMTEDVAFTRDVALTPAPQYGCPLGFPIYCNWDAWACHWKFKACGKPALLTPDMVSQKYLDVVREKRPQWGSRLVMLGEKPESAPVLFDGAGRVRGISPAEAACEVGCNTPGIEYERSDPAAEGKETKLPSGHWDGLAEGGGQYP